MSSIADSVVHVFFLTRRLGIWISIAVAIGTLSCTTVTEVPQVQSSIWPTINSAIKVNDDVEARVDALLTQLSLAEKVGQITQAEIGHVTADDVRQYHLGSVLNGGGSFPARNKHSTIQDWIDLADSFYEASMDDSDGHVAIPLIWGTDAVHGHNNVIGATLYPHNIGLGAANNPELMEKIGRATARTVAATGIDWIFAPTLAVVQDDRWGRTYESYSESPDIVRAYAGRIVNGLQGRASSSELFDDAHLIATAKHFVGDGGTDQGVDQGDNLANEQTLFDIHAQGYVSALAAGAQSVMATFNSWHGNKIHGSRYLLTDVLKQQMGFDGFVVGDWNGHGQVAGCTNESCAAAINAGVDMIMVPEDWKAFIKNTIAQVQRGEISQARLDDAVRRILRVKVRSGMFEKVKPSQRPLAGDQSIIGNAAHRQLARQAVRESLVLLKNNNQILPLSRDMKVLVAGTAADNIGQQSGGWTITWQGTDNENSDFPGATSIYDGINQVLDGKAILSSDGSYTEKPDVAIVVFGETPYAEGQGDRKDIVFSNTFPQELALMRKLKSAGIPIVSVFITGRPLWVNPEINQSDAFVVAWLPGTEGAGVSDVLFKTDSGKISHDFSGRLSFSWPKTPDQFVLNPHDANYRPLFAYGDGLSYGQKSNVSDHLPEQFDAQTSSGSIDNTSNIASVSIFDQRVVAPYAMYVGDSADWQVPLSGAFTESKDQAISVRTTDHLVQEDARQISWSGQGGYSQVYWQSPGTNDFAGLSKNNAVLSLKMRVDKKPSDNVTLRMDCGYPCGGGVDITAVLNNFDVGEWVDFSVSLNCFERDGADMARINTPALLVTAGEFAVTVAKVAVLASYNQKPSIDCHG